jgi:deazaflavin-dependent oxidoreductase (nitroreductase family)
MPNIRWLLALITAVHRAIYRATGGRLGGNLLGIRVLLLTTTGRRSGRERVTPLLYVPDEKGFVVVATNAGDERDPAWWLNLRARPDATVQAGREVHAVRAREAAPDEEAVLWPRLLASYGPYARYRAHTKRHIPVVILERVS